MARLLVAAAICAALVTGAEAALAPPVNDDCAAALSIPGLPFQHDEPALALTRGAPGDPAPSCNGGRLFNSVWFRYTPAATGRVRLTTRTSWDDTVLWVGSGSCTGLAEVACADDNAGFLNAEVEFLAAAGTTYLVAAGSTFPVARGGLTLIAEAGSPLDGPPPANDLCTAATPITAVPSVLVSGGTGATESAGDLAPPCWPEADNYTLWWSYTSPVDRQVRIDTTNSSADTFVTVATGACGALVPIDCDWSSGVNSHGVVDFRARAGVTYRIQVSRYFPPGPGDVVELAVSDGVSAPVEVTVRDSVSKLPIEGAHVQVRDIWGGYYLLREGWTDAAGRCTLHVVEPDTYSLQVVAQGHLSWSQQAAIGTAPLAFDVDLPAMAPPPPPPDEPTRLVVADGARLITFLPDGGDPRTIELPGFSNVRYPTWSPDGSEIGFMGYAIADGFNEIWVIGAGGGGLRRVTSFRGDPFAMVNLSWSPDGAEFAFDWEDPFLLEHAIYVVDAATGTNLRILEHGERPRWSPDASMIAYLDAWGPRVMRRDGSNVATLTGLFTAVGLDWSPDGRRIAISNGNEEIWAIPIEGRDPLKVSATPGNQQTEPVWSPDGCEIAYFDRELGRTYWNLAWSDGAGFRSPMSLVAWSNTGWARHPAPPDAPGDRSPRVDLLDPDGGERLTIGAPYTVRMPASDDGGIVSRDLFLILDDTTVVPVASGLAGPLDEYVWTVGNYPSDTRARLRVVVRDAAGQEHSDTSRYPFSIAGPADDYHAVRLTAPRPGDVVAAGDVLRIAWEYEQRSPFTSDGFHLELSLDGGNTYRAYINDFLTAADRSLDWTVPEYASDEAVVRIRSNGAYDESGPFSISPRAVETRRGGSRGAKLLLLGVRRGAGAELSWGAPASSTNLHRTDDKTVLPAVWSRPLLGSSDTGGFTDPEAAPGPFRPWLYQVFLADCAGNSLP